MAPNLTPRDIEIICCVFQCFKDLEGAKVDYAKLAEIAGLKNTNSAAAVWGPIKKKLLGEAVTPKSTKAKGAKGDAEADEEDEATPTKATAKKPRVRNSKTAGNTGAEEDAGNKSGIVKTEDEDAHGFGTTTSAPNDASSPVAKVTPKKRARKAADDVAANEDGTPVKKRVRKPKDPNAEPKTPAKRAKKAAAVKEEQEEGSGLGSAVADVTGQTFESPYAPVTGGFTAINQMEEQDAAEEDLVNADSKEADQAASAL